MSVRLFLFESCTLAGECLSDAVHHPSVSVMGEQGAAILSLNLSLPIPPPLFHTLASSPDYVFSSSPQHHCSNNGTLEVAEQKYSIICVNCASVNRTQFKTSLKASLKNLSVSGDG